MGNSTKNKDKVQDAGIIKPGVIFCQKCQDKKLKRNKAEPVEKYENQMVILIPKEVFRNDQNDFLLKGILKTIECLAGLLPESELEHDMCIEDQSCDAHVIIAQSCIFEKSPQPK